MSVEQVGNALLQKDVLEVLPEQVEVVIMIKETFADRGTSHTSLVQN
jgi:hypothetical protein